MKIVNLSEGKKIYTSNVYLVTGDWNKLSDVNTLIDVGRDPVIIDKIDNASTGVGKQRIQQVILTHSHYDHASLLPMIKIKYKPKTYAASLALENIDFIIKGGEQLTIGDQQFEVIHTPGHSIDSICLYCKKEKVLFAGDTPLVIRTQDTTCKEEFIQALAYISQQEIETIYFGHGTPLHKNCKKTILNSLKNARSQN